MTPVWSGTLTKMRVEAAEPVRYSLTDELSFSGAFAGAGVAFRRVFADWFELRADVVVGAHFASTRDSVTGTVSDGSATAPVEIEGSGQGVSSANLFVMPGLQAGAGRQRLEPAGGDALNADGVCSRF